MENVTIQTLITEHKNRMPHLRFYSDSMIPYYEYPDMDSYYSWREKTKRLIEINYPGDKHIEEFERISNQDIDPDQQKKLLAILEAFVALPIVIPCTKSSIKQDHKQSPINVTTNINNSNSQTQNQQQSLAVDLFLDANQQQAIVAVDLFLDAIKDDLTGHQIKELKEVVANTDNDVEKARPGIVEKLKSFGADVVSNIVANLLTNPAIWSGL